MKNKTLKFASAGIAGLILSGLAFAELKPKTDSVETKIEVAKKEVSIKTSEKMTAKATEDNTLEQLKTKLKAIFRSEPDKIKESSIPNIYEVMYGTEVVYVSNDGKYFIAGDMINLETRENITEVAKYSIRIAAMSKQDNKPVVFKAKNEKHVLQVFTDIDCGYCRKLHREVPELNDKGITVEYLMFPRAGIGSASFKKAESMWCSDDNKQAMTDAKENKPIKDKICDNPIKAQYNLGQEIGVTGTPALVLESGKLIPGYIPADRLAVMLDAEAAKKN